MVTWPWRRGSLRFRPWASSGWPGALRQLRWMPWQASHRGLGPSAGCVVFRHGCVGNLGCCDCARWLHQEVEKAGDRCNGPHAPAPRRRLRPRSKPALRRPAACPRIGCRLRQARCHAGFHVQRQRRVAAADHDQLGVQVGRAGIDVVGAHRNGVVVEHCPLGVNAPARRGGRAAWPWPAAGPDRPRSPDWACARVRGCWPGWPRCKTRRWNAGCWSESARARPCCTTLFTTATPSSRNTR